MFSMRERNLIAIMLLECIRCKHHNLYRYDVVEWEHRCLFNDARLEINYQKEETGLVNVTSKLIFY